MKTLSSISITMLFLSCVALKREEAGNIDSTFIAWNTATIASLRFEIANQLQPKARDLYKNRLDAFYSYIDIQTDSQLNKNSIRYEFLNKIKDKINGDDFFIIESNLSGERVHIRNFILYPKRSQYVHIELYRYDSEWLKDTVINDFQQTINENILNQRRKWPEGLNNDDVTISHFQNGNLTSVQFYLFGTLDSELAFQIISKM